MPGPGETRCAYSLFQQPWWLDAVAPAGWSEVTVARDGRTLARLPYVLRRRWGLRLIGQPPLTQTLGPWIEPIEGQPREVLEHETRLLSELVTALPPADRFAQSFSPRLLNALPFQCAGYALGVRYTYRLEDLTDEERLWESIEPKVRRNIRTAGKQVELRDDLGLDVFYDTYAKTFARQGLPVPFERELLYRIDAACDARDARLMLFAQDSGGRVHAVDYVVYDGDVAYALLGGGDPDLRRSGAGMLLQWRCIQSVRGRTRVFDFEGSMLPTVERVNRRFGARQTPYVVVSRGRAPVRAAAAVRDIAAGLRAGR